MNGEFVCTGGTSVAPKPAQAVCPPTKKALFKQNKKTGKCPDNLSCMYDDGQVTSSCGCLNDQIVCSDLRVALPPVKPAIMDTCPDEEKTFIANKDICKDGLKCRFKNSSYHVRWDAFGDSTFAAYIVARAHPGVLVLAYNPHHLRFLQFLKRFILFFQFPCNRWCNRPPVRALEAKSCAVPFLRILP